MPALNVQTRARTAQQIVAAAEIRSGNPNRHLDPSSGSEALTAPAYVALQGILDTLEQSYDWPFTDDATTITISTRTTTLPLDFWRVTFASAFLTDPESGGRFPIPLIGHEEFHRQLTPSTHGTGQPVRLTVFKNLGYANGVQAPQGSIMADPVPNKPYYLELHYNPMRIPLAGITTIPWFPWSEYLTEALLVKIYFMEDDTRVAGAIAERDRLLAVIRQGMSDAGQRPAAIRLSSTHYRTPVRLH